MAAPRRTGTETSETRALLLDVTERVMVEDGYAAVSSRRIAKEAGVTAALVHYYFGTLDDLFIAVVRRGAEQQLERQARLLDSPQPLHALWKMSAEPAGIALVMELVALSNHRKVIRAELAARAEAFRQAQLGALRSHLERSGVDPKSIDPAVVMVLVAGLSRTVVMEKSLGMKVGHKETLALVQRLLDRYEGPADARPRTKRAPARKKPGV